MEGRGGGGGEEGAWQRAWHKAYQRGGSLSRRRCVAPAEGRTLLQSYRKGRHGSAPRYMDKASRRGDTCVRGAGGGGVRKWEGHSNHEYVFVLVFCEGKLEGVGGGGGPKGARTAGRGGAAAAAGSVDGWESDESHGTTVQGVESQCEGRVCVRKFGEL